MLLWVGTRCAPRRTYGRCASRRPRVRSCTMRRCSAADVESRHQDSAGVRLSHMHKYTNTHRVHTHTHTTQVRYVQSTCHQRTRGAYERGRRPARTQRATLRRWGGDRQRTPLSRRAECAARRQPTVTSTQKSTEEERDNTHKTHTYT